MDLDLFWGIALTLTVLGVLGMWFRACGRADRMRRSRPFARRTLVYAGGVFVVGLAFLTSDIGATAPEGRMGLVAITIGSFLLLYSATSALIAANDEATVFVNLTGRALLLADPDLAPFYTLPAPNPEPACELPPALPRTWYVVSPELGQVAADSGRTDVLTVDRATAIDPGGDGPVRVRRLVRAARAP